MYDYNFNHILTDSDSLADMKAAGDFDSILFVMCDYSAHGLWKGGHCINVKELPSNTHHLYDEIERWQFIFESLDFGYPTGLELKLLRQSIYYDKFIYDGLVIADKLRKLLPRDIAVVYYDERNDSRHLML